MMAALLVVLSFLVLLACAPAHAAPAEGPIGLCRAAIAAAERAAAIPPGLLHAIGRVESGRRDPDSGAFGPWPWTINADGRGQFFPTREAAIAAVRQLQAQGVRSIDVGCLQVNLRHHPEAFRSLEEAFDPEANARYAARYLRELHAASNDWLRAAANYHSHTPALAEAYRARVEAAWPEERARALALASAPRAVPLAGAAGAALPAGIRGAERVLPAPLLRPGGAAGPAGRNLDSYRAMPIPLAGRMPASSPLRR